MHRFRMLRSAPAENKANHHDHQVEDRRAGMLSFRSNSGNNNNRQRGGGNGSLKNLFVRRTKSAELVAHNNDNNDSNTRGGGNGGGDRLARTKNRRPRHGDSTNHSEAFSERTQSTLSMSLSSSRGAEDLQSSSVARLQKSAILRELLPLEEAENSVEISTSAELQQEEEEEQPPVAEICASEEQDEVEIPVEEEAPVVSVEDEEEIVVVDPITPSAAEPEYLLRKHPEHAEELGYMEFEYTNLAEACQAAYRADKPVLAFSTEFPGDEEIGQAIFSHPLLVEAIRTLFVPVLCVEEPTTSVRRSTTGRRCRCSISLLEAATMESLIADDSLWGDNLTQERVVRSMLQALGKLGKHLPKYLRTLHEGLATTTTSNRGEQVFVMGTRQPTRGEIEFAELPGVTAVKSAFFHRQRVCVVSYDHRRISYSKLLRYALQQDSLCDSIYHGSNEERVAAQIEIKRSSPSSAWSSYCPPVILPLTEGEFQNDMASKPALRKTPMRHVPLTYMQSMKANQLIHQGHFDEAMHILSPWQGQMLMRAMRGASSKTTLYDLIDVPILSAWQSLCQEKHPKVILLESLPAAATSPEGEETTCESDDDDRFGL